MLRLYNQCLDPAIILKDQNYNPYSKLGYFALNIPNAQDFYSFWGEEVSVDDTEAHCVCSSGWR